MGITSTENFDEIAMEILTKAEIEANFKILGRYIDEETTPVPPFAFIRKEWIIQTALDMSTIHNRMIVQLYLLLQREMLKNGYSEAPFQVFHTNRLNLSSLTDDREESIPDIAVYPQPIKGDYGSIPQGMIPLLVIEVISNSTAYLDTFEKKSYYRKIKVPNYWLIKKADNANEGLESSLFFRLKGDRYHDVTPEFQDASLLICPELNNLKLSPNEIWYKDSTEDISVKLIQTENELKIEKERANKEKEKADRLEKELLKYKK